MLEVVGLRKSYGDLIAVDGVSLKAGRAKRLASWVRMAQARQLRFRLSRGWFGRMPARFASAGES